MKKSDIVEQKQEITSVVSKSVTEVLRELWDADKPVVYCQPNGSSDDKPWKPLAEISLH